MRKLLLLLGLLFLASPVWANRPDFVQANNAQAASVAYSSNNRAGNLLLAMTRSTLASPTISDTLVNTWTLAKQQLVNAGGNTLSIWYAANSKVGANTVTIASGGSVFDLVVAEYSGGIFTVNPLDQTSNGTGNGTAVSTGDLSITQANELIIGAVANDTANGKTFTAGSGFTSRSAAGGSSNGNLFLEDKVVTSNSASIPVQGTYGGGTVNWGMVSASFFFAFGSGFGGN